MMAALELQLPGWVGYAIILASFAGLGIPMFLSWRRDVALNAQYLSPPWKMPIAVRVRGPDGAPVDLERFGRCWVAAFDCISLKGPWPRYRLVERLGPGSKVQVMPTATWPSTADKKVMVGGELVAGVLRIGPNFDVLCHELIHRAEEVVDPEHAADGAHQSWPNRGLTAADEAYRAWLTASA